MKKGKLLEILVQQIETTLKENDQVAVSTDVKLRDKDGIPRQIDVLVTVEFGKRLGKAYIIIECKDKGRRVEVGQIGSFMNLVESIPGCTKGIFVSKKGFNSGAIIKAKATKKVELFHFKSDSQNIADKLFCSNVFKIGYEIPNQNFKLQVKTSIFNKVWNTVKDLEKSMLYNHEYKYQGYSPTDWPFFTAGKMHVFEVIKSLQNKAVELAEKNLIPTREEVTVNFSFEKDWFINTKGFQWNPVSDIAIKMLVDFIAVPSLKSTFYEYQMINNEPDATVDLFEFPHHYLQVVKPKDEAIPRFFVLMKNDLTNITEIVRLGSFLDIPPNEVNETDQK